MNGSKLANGLLIVAIVFVAGIIMTGDGLGATLDDLGVSQVVPSSNQPALDVRNLDATTIEDAVRRGTYGEGSGTTVQQPASQRASETLRLPERNLNEPAAQQPAPSVPEGRTVVVPRDTTFDEIASVYDGAYPHQLVELNPNVDPNNVPAGTALIFPEDAEYDVMEAARISDQYTAAERAEIVEDAVRGDRGRHNTTEAAPQEPTPVPKAEYTEADVQRATTVENAVRRPQPTAAAPKPAPKENPYREPTPIPQRDTTVIEDTVRGDTPIPTATMTSAEKATTFEDAVRR